MSTHSFLTIPSPQRCWPLSVSLCLLFLMVAGCGKQRSASSPGEPFVIPPPEIVGPPPPLAFLNQFMKVKILGRNGTSPYVFQTDGSSLPGGVTLAADGTLTGSPGTQGSFPFKVTLTDSETPAKTASATFTLNVTTPLQPFSIQPLLALRGDPLALPALQGGLPPYIAQLSAGALPLGISINSSGAITGTFAQTGMFSPQILWTDALGQTATSMLQFQIEAHALKVLPLTSQLLDAGNAVSARVVATGGTPPYSFFITDGSLPAGVQLDSSGLLSGRSSASGVYPFQITVTDADITPQQVAISGQIAILTAHASFDPSGAVATIAANAYGLHTSVYDNHFADSKTLPALLQTAGVRVLRYPSGSYADRYHWITHALTPNFAPSAAGTCATVWNGFRTLLTNSSKLSGEAVNTNTPCLTSCFIGSDPVFTRNPTEYLPT